MIARRRAALDVSVAMIGAKMSLDSAGDEEPYLPVTGVRHPSPSPGCPDYTGHNVLEVQGRRSSGFLLLISGSEALCLLVYPASHTYVHQPISEKWKLAELLHLGEVAIPTYSAFVGHGNLQQGR